MFFEPCKPCQRQLHRAGLGAGVLPSTETDRQTDRHRQTHIQANHHAALHSKPSHARVGTMLYLAGMRMAFSNAVNICKGKVLAVECNLSLLT